MAPEVCSFTIEENPNPADHLAFLKQPINTEIGKPVTPCPSVGIFDSNGELICQYEGIMCLIVEPCEGCCPVDAPKVCAQAAGGKATFCDLRINQFGCFRLRAHVDGMADVLSDPFTVWSTTQLGVWKVGSPAAVKAGDIITYTLGYGNAGTKAATDVVICDRVPDGTEFVAADNGGSYDPATGCVTWLRGTVPAKTQEPYPSVSFQVCVNGGVQCGGAIVNDKCMYWIACAEHGPACGTKSVNIPIGCPPEFGGHLPPKEATGMDPNTNVQLHVTDDIRVNYRSVTIWVNANLVYEGARETGNEIYCSPWGTCRRSGPDTDYIFTYVPDPPFDFGARIDVKIEAADSHVPGEKVSDEYPFWTRPQLLPRLSISKTASPAQVTLDELEITYTLDLSNTDEGTATNVVVEDPLPQYTSYVPSSATGGGVYAGGKVTWAVGHLSPGEHSTVSFRVTVTDIAGAAQAGNITNKDYTAACSEVPTPVLPQQDVVIPVHIENSPPHLYGQSPVPGAIGVPTDTNIEFHVADNDMAGIQGTSLRLLINGQVVYDGSVDPPPVVLESPIGKIECSGSGTPADYYVSFDPSTLFAYCQQVTVAVSAADTAGKEMTQQYSFRIRCRLLSDVNYDCKINVLDLIFVRNRLGKPVTNPDIARADVNNDGRINVLDLICVRNDLGKSCQ